MRRLTSITVFGLGALIIGCGESTAATDDDQGTTGLGTGAAQGTGAAGGNGGAGTAMAGVGGTSTASGGSVQSGAGGNSSPGGVGGGGQVTVNVPGMGGAGGQTTDASGGTAGVESSGGGSSPEPAGGGAAPQGMAGAGTGGETQGMGGSPVQVQPEPVVVERPSLVTSGPNAYWQVGEVMEVQGGNPSVSVDTGTTHQEWLGFGGTFNEAGWDVLMLLDEAERDRALKLLFSPAEGANFKWGRIPMGSSDFAMSRYSLAETADDFTMDNFSIDRDKEMLIPYIKAALAIKPDVRLWASPWSPPAWMKDNNDINGGNMRGDAQILEAYALYFAKFVEDYAAEGLTIEHVEPQNEPGYETRYPSCLWSAQLLSDFVGSYLGPTLEEHGLDTEIWFGTMSAPEDSAHINAALQNQTTRGYLTGFGLQWNTMNSTGMLSDAGFYVMQTEHKCGNYPWESSTFNPDRPPNDDAYARESWGLIRDWLNAGVHIYSAWNMVLDTQGQNLDEQRPWPQNSLLVVDRNANTLTATPAYYVFRHLSYFVDPGAVRVGLSGNANGLAFENPDGSIVAVIHNSGQATEMTLGIGGTAVQFTVPGQGWASVYWEG